MDTIFALATAPGRAGVAVIRLSGPAAHDAVRRLAGDLPPARQAALRRLRAADGAVLDEALVLTFAAGHSFTGEDVAEFQVHGSPAIVRAVLATVADLPGLRPAEAGEFTRRALENERLDLAQVEGLADLIEAETEAQRKQAYAVFSGALGVRADGWRAALVRAAALIEATIDFVDEDVPVDVFPEVRALLDGVRGELRAEAAGVEAAERLRDGFEVAIVGKPNTGKSTLMNAIAGRDVAITSEIAGTTRDVIELRTDIRGLPVTFLDTAGLRGTEDLVEAMGVARAAERAEAADLRIFLREPGEDDLPVRPQPGDLSLVAKGDLNRDAGPSVSGVTGEGIAEMLDEIADVLGARVAQVGTATRQRHRRALNVAFDALLAADEEMALGEAARHELVAERLREASRALDQLIGRVDVEDLLDHIFSSFCIGK